MTKHTEEERLESARMSFKKRNMKAKLLLNTDRYTAIDWRRADGSGDYYCNFIIDKKRGSLIISGDLGDCIATWYNENSVHKIASYVNSVDYFIGKFQCASDKYDCDEDDVADEIKERIKERYDGDELPEDFEDDWDDFESSITDSIHHDEFIPDTEQSDFLEEYLGDDWWDGLDHVGQTIDIRVYLWVVGLQMAVDQLTERGELTEED